MISAATQALLLLTGPLITGQAGATAPDLLTPGEYRKVARHLRSLDHQPADLLGPTSIELLQELDAIISADRMRCLLDRGFLLSQAIERWQSRAIWVMSRADSGYPRRIENRLKDDSPAVLYGCGETRLLQTGGLAVVGSRHVDQTLIDQTETIGRQCALFRKSVISGGAQGIDRAAMRGALAAGGQVVGVLADSLERAALNRDNRSCLLNAQLVLLSPYDPSAGFNIGHAMQRNKLIYALADAALVMSADYEEGGTWAGASEQLQKLRFVPVYIRSSGDAGPGLRGLERMGAQLWPNPQNSDEFFACFAQSVTPYPPSQLSFFLQPLAPITSSEYSPHGKSGSNTNVANAQPQSFKVMSSVTEQSTPEPGEASIAGFPDVLVDLLGTPKTAKEVGLVLRVSTSEARLLLQKWVKEGTLEKHKPSRFVLKQRPPGERLEQG